MTFYEAADMAKRAGVKELWLTHFSPSLVRAEDYMPQVRDIFANAYLGKDAKSVELMFDELAANNPRIPTNSLLRQIIRLRQILIRKQNRVI